jgi:hypothetical protein
VRWLEAVKPPLPESDFCNTLVEKYSMIKKIKGKYIVLSETTERSFGSYHTLSEAKKRLRQVEFFKHLSKGKKKSQSAITQNF